MKQTILLTGATGFLGKYVIKELETREYKIIAIGRNAKIGKERESENCKFYQVDFINKEELEKVFIKENIDIVIHCGALSSAWGKWKDLYECNAEGTKNVSELSYKYNVKRLIYISSPSIYSEKKDRLDIKEEEYNPKNKLNYYIMTKIMSEEVINQINKKGLYTIIIRPRGLIGVGDPSLMPRIMRANKKIGIPLFNEGKKLVDVTCVENVAYACYLAVISENTNGEVFNITNNEPQEFKTLLQKFCLAADEEPKFFKLPFGILYFVASVIETIYKIFKLDKEPVITKYTLCTLAFSQTLNIDKAKKMLNYEPKISLEEGINKYGKWWKENSQN